MIGSDGPGVGGAAPPGLLVRKTGAGRGGPQPASEPTEAWGHSVRPVVFQQAERKGEPSSSLGRMGQGEACVLRKYPLCPGPGPQVLVSEPSEPGRGTRGGSTGPASLSVPSPCSFPAPPHACTHPRTHVTHAHVHTRALSLSPVHVLHVPALLHGDERKEDPPQRGLPPAHTTASFCPSRYSKSRPGSMKR